jgi:hypothetical protein
VSERDAGVPAVPTPRPTIAQPRATSTYVLDVFQKRSIVRNPSNELVTAQSVKRAP